MTDDRHIGDLSYKDVTPIAQLFTEYTGFAVAADGPIKSAADLVKALADKGINIQLITTSEIKTSVLIDDEYAELAVRALHTYYGLDKPAA